MNLFQALIVMVSSRRFVRGMARNPSSNILNPPVSTIISQSSSETIIRVGFHAAILKAAFGKLNVKLLLWWAGLSRLNGLQSPSGLSYGRAAGRDASKAGFTIPQTSRSHDTLMVTRPSKPLRQTLPALHYCPHKRPPLPGSDGHKGTRPSWPREVSSGPLHTEPKQPPSHLPPGLLNTAPIHRKAG
jgi:hypothetical protein